MKFSTWRKYIVLIIKRNIYINLLFKSNNFINNYFNYPANSFLFMNSKSKSSTLLFYKQWRWPVAKCAHVHNALSHRGLHLSWPTGVFQVTVNFPGIPWWILFTCNCTRSHFARLFFDSFNHITNLCKKIFLIFIFCKS